MYWLYLSPLKHAVVGISTLADNSAGEENSESHNIFTEGILIVNKSI